MSTLILQGSALTGAAARDVAGVLGGRTEERGNHFRIITDSAPAPGTIAELRERLPFDINLVPAGFDPAAVRLLMSDMDSTMINIECADEIGDFLGIKDKVAAITRQAMRGDIDFETSLTRRLALLKGVGVDVLQKVYDDRLRPNTGAEALVAGLQARGVKTALVSGGFTFFTERLRTRLGLDYTLANELEIVDGHLTGDVHGAIVGAAAKADYLKKLCGELGIRPDQTIAVGDGANDLGMVELAGLGVAFRAKPALEERSHVLLRHSGLDSILAFLDK